MARSYKEAPRRDYRVASLSFARTIGAALIARPDKTVRRSWPGSVRNREDRGQTAASSQLGTRKDSREESQETWD